MHGAAAAALCRHVRASCVARRRAHGSSWGPVRLPYVAVLAVLLVTSGCPDDGPPAGISVSGGKSGDQFTCTASLGAGDILYSLGNELSIPLADGRRVSLSRVGLGGTVVGSWRGPQVQDSPVGVSINLHVNPRDISVQAQCTRPDGHVDVAGAGSPVEIDAWMIKSLEDDEETITF